MNKKAIYFLAGAALLVSCADNVQELDIQQSEDLKQIVMTTEDFQPEAGSRILYEIADGAVICNWATHDTVGVFPDKGIQTAFPMASGAGTKNATFDGGGWALKDGSTYAAYYPFNGDFYLDKHSVPVSYLGQVQDGDGSMAHLGAYDYMVATPVTPEFGSANFKFKHLGALVGLKLTVPKPSTLEFVKFITDEGVFVVEGKVDIMAGTPTITPTTSSNEMLLELQNIKTTKENQVVTLYLMLPPVDLSTKTLKAVVCMDTGMAEVALEGKNFQAGKVYAFRGELEEMDAVGDGTYKEGVVSLAEPGTMKQLLGDDCLNITSLKVVGPMNGDDVICLRQMLGAKVFEESDRGNLAVLDLTEATIVEGGSWYYEDSSSNRYYTSRNVLGAYMFYECVNLQEMELPGKVNVIGDYAFYNSTSLVSIDILHGVTTIGNAAFSSCSRLNSVYIPSSVTMIGDNAFYDCWRLKSVHLTDLSAWCNINFNNEYSNLLYYGAKLYLNDEALTDLVIPEDITEIKPYAFYMYKTLASVSLGKNVTQIGSYAFTYCNALTSIDIPDNVVTLGENAFYRCEGLTTVTIGDGLTAIADRTFGYCNGLTSVIIGDCVKSIGIGAFYDCTSLASVKVGAGVTYMSWNVFTGCNAITEFYCNASTPPNVGGTGGYSAFWLFQGTNPTLYVPKGCVSKYESSAWGTYFKTIAEMD